MIEEKVFVSAVKWEQGKEATLSNSDKPLIAISTPPEFDGPAGFWSPEELFLSSINSCILTTFLHLVEKFSASFLTYESSVEGKVNLTGGKLLFTSITVRPRILVPDETQKQKIARVVEKSEKYCLISASVKSEIQVLPEIRVK